MKPLTFLLVFVFIIALIGCGNDGPPTARIIPEELSIHGETRTDNYYWLRERENPEVIAYLEAENEYAAGVMAQTAELQNTLFEEIKGRIKPNDESVPVLLNGYYYYTRFEAGTEYPVYCRKEGSLEAEEEVTLNVNEMAGDHEFLSVTGVVASPDNNLLAYGVDNIGRRKYELHFKNLLTGEQLGTIIKDVIGRAVWANDNNTAFYTRRDPDTLRAFQIYRQALGGEAVLVYQEDDVIFSCGVDKSKSREYIIISSNHTLSNEYRYLDADDPAGEFRIIQSRERGLEYYADQLGKYFYILTNMEAENFRLMRAPLNTTEKENWEEVIPHRDDILLQGFELFKNYLVVSERGNALTRVRVIPWSGDEEHYVEFPEEVCAARISRSNPEFDTDMVRLNYSSLVTPQSVYDYNMATREKVLKKQDEVPGYNREAYTTKRLRAPADDDKEVPVSLVYKTELFKADGSNPCLLYSYGSYGFSTDPGFRPSVFSLLDRGFVFGVGHIRGGQEMGRQWYEDGKLLNKINTFTDFNDVAHYLIDEQFTSSDRLFAMGGSAGGLLMGAVANLEPQLYRGLIAHVPFVDVVTTMLDANIPLTTFEWDEWGNPQQEEHYRYMLSYSPYDQVEAKDYPNLLVTTSLHDSQVQYWEPAKWVAKLRKLKTDNNRLLLKTNMEGGHGGTTGRYKRLRDTAYDYAFMLDLLERQGSP